MGINSFPPLREVFCYYHFTGKETGIQCHIDSNQWVLYGGIRVQGWPENRACVDLPLVYVAPEAYGESKIYNVSHWLIQEVHNKLKGKCKKLINQGV